MWDSVSKKTTSLRLRSKLIRIRATFLLKILMLSLAILPARAAKCSNAPISVSVSKPEGVVEIMTPGSAAWHQVKRSRRIPLFSNLKLDAGTSIDVSISGSYQLPKSFKGNSISLKGPMSVIVDQNFVRKIKFNRFFWENIPDELMKLIAKSETSAVDSRLSMLRDFVEIRNVDKNRADTDKLTKNASSFLSLNIQVAEIDILSPVHGDAFYVSSFPFDLQITWTKTLENSGYFLLIWPSDQEVGAPAATILGSRYTHSFSSPGEYYIQVISADGKRRSNPSLIHVLTELNSSNTKNAAQSDFYSPIFPIDLTIFTKTPTTIAFNWETPTNKNEIGAELVISQVGSLAEKRVPIPVGVESILLEIKKHGEYRWHLEFNSKADNKKRSSQIAIFTLLNEEKHFSQNVKSILMANDKESRTNYHSYIFW